MINDEFLDLLFEVKANIRSNDYLEMMKEVNEGFKEHRDKASPLFRPYLTHLCTAMDAWNISLS